MSGPRLGYRFVGRQLVRQFWNDMDDMDPVVWTEVASLFELLEAGAVASSLEWFRSHHPEMVRLIPRTQLHQFIDGAIGAHLEMLQ
jgi:hypothetical protein